MQTSSQPKLLPVPFADAGSKQNIPNDSQIGITAGRASYVDGFPPLTRTPLAAGGVPPFGTDFNGVLNDITAAVRWSQSGSGYPFNAAFNTAISGYPKGARIPNSTLDGYWLNTTDGNTANPEVTGAATTGWVPAESYGVTAITGLSGSSVTLTTLQASKERITLAGTLSANINLVLPAWIKRWTVVNNCTGAFSVTVKTPNGNGVPVSSGATAILQGDGTDILPGANPGGYMGTRVFTTSGTYTPTLGTKRIKVTVIGGGGGGGGSAATDANTRSCGGGGGAGNTAVSLLDVFSLTLPVSINVGTAGAAGAAGGGSGGNGGQGGATTFGSYITATGGFGGGGGSLASDSLTAVTANGGTSAAPTTGNILNQRGSAGLQGIVGSNAIVSGAGGASSLGGGGNPVAVGASTAGENGIYGGGGSGAISIKSSSIGRAGGAGGVGVVVIEEYA